MKTFWLCDECHAVGTLTSYDDDDVMTVIHALDRKHQEVSPDCDNTGLNLRTLNFTHILRVADTPEWAVEPLVELIDERDQRQPAAGEEGER